MFQSSAEQWHRRLRKISAINAVLFLFAWPSRDFSFLLLSGKAGAASEPDSASGRMTFQLARTPQVVYPAMRDPNQLSLLEKSESWKIRPDKPAFEAYPGGFLIQQATAEPSERTALRWKSTAGLRCRHGRKTFFCFEADMANCNSHTIPGQSAYVGLKVHTDRAPWCIADGEMVHRHR